MIPLSWAKSKTIAADGRATVPTGLVELSAVEYS